MQEHFANCERYFISESKSKVMIFNEKRTDSRVDEFYLHDKPLEIVSEYTHIGMEHLASGKEMNSERIKMARRTCYSLMGAGMHGYNGINPEVIIKLWNTYIKIGDVA